ncbi:hypothetical protein QJU96_05295 [Pasteurella skyensis]|uniref:Uncharacterized protein n=1 Tax=Phocoenobacter skyensis TaxID=97481 RepID=A0AAJ6NDG8_9PAST|nr:hypothetical protein [Pasteurella skyensis]MDP8170702.1 hypothetical protein [Pasteurella skyensis]MDP8174817.1 hypothetical protein [Pasteurella skyensis]
MNIKQLDAVLGDEEDTISRMANDLERGEKQMKEIEYMATLKASS